ncbi:MAG: SUMF1/EgtB/PvdO family nonheme iron enzyme [bacterium]|nr:SUMF1/EgtB/PvdO family nonheme iron enzyme [bacterium]
MKKQCINAFLLASALIVSASSAEAATFDWAIIGNPGNPDDVHGDGYGSVGYQYSIAAKEVTTAQYVEFLNAVAATDTYGLYNTNMSSSASYQGITRSGGSGSYEYSSNAGWENRPVVYVSWYDTLRFTNWLHNGQLTGAQNNTTTEYGAYDMSLGTSVVRLSGAEYWLPSEDEWYKAAYYNPVNEEYYNYATGSDTLPSRTVPSGDTGNSANYYDDNSHLGLLDVGAYDESESPYGTYDQNGNVWEWNEALIGSNRGLRGGSWGSSAFTLAASFRHSTTVTTEHNGIGFRVASSYIGGDVAVPEPASVGLVLLSVGGLILRWAKKV